MKLTKRLLVLALVLVLTLALAVPAFAAGTDGTITINNATQGQTYKAYKIFDVVGVEKGDDTTYYYYADATVAAKLTGDNCPFSVSTTASNNSLYAVTLKDASESDVSGWIKDNVIDSLTAVGTVVASSSTVTLNVGEYGFYYVTSTLGSAVMVNSATPTITIIDKNVTWEKPITEAFKYILNDNDEQLSETTAQIGDEVKFVIGFYAQNFIAKKDNEDNVTGSDLVKQYTVVDTPTGLNIDPDKITVKITYDDVPGASTDSETVEKVPHTATVDSTTGAITITIPWAEDKNANVDDAEENWVSLYDAPARVVINYSGELTDTTATNEADIMFLSVDGENNNEDPEEPKTPEVDTATINLTKVDGNDNTQLDNAEFTLTDSAKNTISFVVNEAGTTYTVATPEEIDDDDIETTSTIVAGKISIVGLDGSETYTLTETKAPAGYNVGEAETVTFSKDSGYVTDVDFVNFSGTQLPTTGGMGTTALYILGAVLVLGAGVLLVVRRRMSAE